MADDAPPTTPATAAPTGATAVVDPPEIAMPPENARALPTDMARLVEARNQLRRELPNDIEAELQLAASAQTSLDADAAAAEARLAITKSQIEELKGQMAKHQAEIDRLKAEADPLGDGSIDSKLEAGEDLARHQAALRAQQNVVTHLEQRQEDATAAKAAAEEASTKVEADWAAKRAGYSAAEQELDRLDEKILILGDEKAANVAAELADASAREMDASGDTAGAAQLRAIAAQHRADAAAKAAQAAAIEVNPQVLVDAGLDIPVVTSLPTPDGSVDPDGSTTPEDGTGPTPEDGSSPTPEDGEPSPTDTTEPTGEPEPTGETESTGETEPTGEAEPTPEPEPTGGTEPAEEPAPAATPTSSTPGEIEMEPEFVGRSPDGEAMAAEAAKMRETLGQRLAADHAELQRRHDEASDQVTAAKAIQASAEQDVADYQKRLTQIDADETELWKKLSEMDEDADPAAYAEVLEDVRTHMAAADRQRSLIESRTAVVDKAKADLAELETKKAAAGAEADEFGVKLRDADAELDVMERRAGALDEQYRHEQNARTFTDLAGQASDRGDEAEAKRLRQRAVEELDGANAAGAVLDANPLTPGVVEAAGLRDSAGASEAGDAETPNASTDTPDAGASTDAGTATDAGSDPAFESSFIGASTPVDGTSPGSDSPDTAPSDNDTAAGDETPAPSPTADGSIGDDTMPSADFDPVGVSFDEPEGSTPPESGATDGDGEALPPATFDDGTNTPADEPMAPATFDDGSNPPPAEQFEPATFEDGSSGYGDGYEEPSYSEDPGYVDDSGYADAPPEDAAF